MLTDRSAASILATLDWLDPQRFATSGLGQSEAFTSTSKAGGEGRLGFNEPLLLSRQVQKIGGIADGPTSPFETLSFSLLHGVNLPLSGSIAGTSAVAACSHR